MKIMLRNTKPEHRVQILESQVNSLKIVVDALNDKMNFLESQLLGKNTQLLNSSTHLSNPEIVKKQSHKRDKKVNINNALNEASQVLEFDSD